MVLEYEGSVEIKGAPLFDDNLKWLQFALILVLLYKVNEQQHSHYMANWFYHSSTFSIILG